MRNFIRKINIESIKMVISTILVLSMFVSPLSSFVSVSHAAFNKQINYQGKLTNSSNVAVANGTYNMEFKLYNSVPSVIWTETRTNGNRVQVTNGLFSVMLGEVNSLSGVDFNQTLTLGVNIGGTAVSPSWDGEMSPRKKLGAVPAAVEAENSANVNIANDVATATSVFPTWVSANLGNQSQKVSSTKLSFIPSTGILTATGFAGSGAGLTALPAGQLSGTIPSAVLGNSTAYIGTTAVLLNRASANLALTGITSIDGSAASLKSVSTTGLMTVTGMGAGTTRAKTVRDADDTILELGGSYTPTGTWTSLKLNEGVALTSTSTDLNYLSAATGTTGTTSTNIVFSTSPTLVTPVLGAATATSINNLVLSQDNTDFNVKVGTNAGLNLVAGAQFNTFLGYEAGKSAAAGGTNAADWNTAVGYGAFSANTIGQANTANGFLSLASNTTGSANTASGIFSLNANMVGAANTANGVYSLGANTADGNSAYGYYSLATNTTGTANTAIGYEAGRYIANGSTSNLTSDYSLYLGSNTKAGADNNQNEIVVGYNAIGGGSNTATWGNTSILNHYFAGNINATKMIGGSSTTADLTLQTTSGVGATGADMHFLVGNNGTTEAMTILNNGNVGIGTNAPGSQFEVYGTDPRVSSKKSDGSTALASFSATGTLAANPRASFLIGSPSGDSITNVGLTVSPDVSTAVQKSAFIEVRTNPVNSASEYRVSLQQTTSLATIIASSNSGSTVGTPLSLYTYGNTNQLYLNTDGNVGIGNNISPDSKLSINSSSDNVSIMTLRFPAGSTGDKVGILFKGNDGTYNINYAEVTGGVESWSGDDGFIGFRTSNATTLAERMRLTSNGTLEVGFNYTGQSGTLSNGLIVEGRTLLGATSEAVSSSKLYVAGTTAANGSTSAIAGILGGYTFNPTAGGVQVGNRFVVTNSPTTTANTAVGEIIRIVDNSGLANTVRGLDVTADGGSTTAGVNTAIRGSGGTFGIQGITTALAGGTTVPAAIYGESSGTTQGDILRLYSNSVTSAPSFATFYHDSSTFTGTGLLMDFAAGSGGFTGNFADFKKNSTSMFRVTNAGVTSMGLSGTASSTALCSSLANGTAPTAGVAYEIRDCSASPVADYAEMYPVADDIEFGDIVAIGTDMVMTYGVTDGNVDWNKEKGEVTKLIKSDKIYQKNVVGIVSDNYNDFSSTGNNIKDKDNPMPVALTGRVPVKISNSSPEINPGDYVTTSFELGKATKATKSGFAIGKALEKWSPDSGQETVMIYLEQGYQEGEELTETTFEGLTFFNGDAQFMKSVVFNSQVEFAVPPLFNNDTAGFAVIKAGSNKVEVIFDKPYIAQPVVSAMITLEDSDTTNMTDAEANQFFNEEIKSVVTNKTQNKFTIRINKTASQDIRFSWIALAVKDPKVFESVIEGLVIEQGIPTPVTPTTTTGITDGASPTDVTPESQTANAGSTETDTSILDTIINSDIVQSIIGGSDTSAETTPTPEPSPTVIEETPAPSEPALEASVSTTSSEPSAPAESTPAL